MINKQNLWFVTLFSLILILGIYYVSMGDEVTNILDGESNITSVLGVEESDIIVALQVEEDESVLKEMNEYKSILLDVKTTVEEKNNAYDALQALTNLKVETEKITKIITDKFKYNNFVKIDGDTISIVIASKEHNEKIANNIIRTVQELYESQKYITVKFE